MADRKFKTRIGGQAVMEGVMMRSGKLAAVAVRRPDGQISIKEYQLSLLKEKFKFLGWPIIRGVVNFGEMMVFGYKTLMYSAAESGFDDIDSKDNVTKPIDQTALQTDEEQLPDATLNIDLELNADKHLTEVTLNNDLELNEEKNNNNKNKTGDGIMMIAASFIGVILAVGLFTILPVYLVGTLDLFLPIEGYRSLVEGLLKFIIFTLYLFLVTRLKEIHRVFEYHGAEHKTIACYEAGEPLTPENAAKHSRFHPRCGTSFLFIVLFIGIIVASFITWNSLLIRILIKLITLPLVAGIAYEIITLAGKYDNFVTRTVSAPGLLFQRLSAFEPDVSQLEVAIAAFLAVKPVEDELEKW